MHLNILSPEQINLLNTLSQFKREYYLVGGTAIALHIGHRESIDFDLFKEKDINKKTIYDKLKNIDYKVSFADYNQVNMISNGVKITFFSFPYIIPREAKLENYLFMPNLLCLAAMKAFTLGRRAKWKDYVDLYFILKDHFSVKEITKKATELFGNEFIEKQFIAQLGYFKGINYDEQVVYLINNPPKETEIQKFLINVSISEI